MQIVFIRLIKSAILSIIVFLSSKYLGFSAHTALIFALVPLILGTMNVMVGVGYLITTIVLILAFFSTLLPTSCPNAVDCTISILTDTGVINEINHAGKKILQK